MHSPFFVLALATLLLASVPAAAAPHFVTSAACVDCHREQAAAWQKSTHAKAMQEASAASVLGDFGDVRFEAGGLRARFFRADRGWFVETEGARHRVAYTFGVEPLQQILIPAAGGRFQSFPIAWDTRGRRWFHLYPELSLRPGEALHWTGRYQSWNLMCADCHSTGLRKNYDAAQDRYRTTWAEISVGCEACHGPGERHVQWARPAATGQRAQDPGAATGFAVDLHAGGPQLEIETCARCHARRHAISAADEPGAPLLDHFVPETLRPELYHADGQIEQEVYEYGSFVQSRMYQAGVRCSDCHDPHTGGSRAAGNALCLRCHSESPDARFAERLEKKAYDTPEHHFHSPGSEAALCVSCHMPSRTYMVVDPRRDHGLRVPRPDLSVRLGTPNACNDCHSDRSPAWAAQAVIERYGPLRRRGSDWAEAIDGGRKREPSAEASLIALAGDTARPAIVRATAIELLAGYGDAGARLFPRVSRDPDPLVRRAAAASLAALAPEARVGRLAPLLTDPVRAVRIEAAWALAPVPDAAFAAGERRHFEAALAEYRAAQEAMADWPAAQQNLAQLAALRGDAKAAEAGYRRALEFDAGFWPASVELARLLNASARNSEAERVLRAALVASPNEGELHYMLGLLLAEEGRVPEAAPLLSDAARLLPAEARVQYNLGLSLQHLGQLAPAEAAFAAALRLAPGDSDVVRALAILLAQQARWREALPHARRLVELEPGEPGAQRLLRQIEQRIAAGATGPG